MEKKTLVLGASENPSRFSHLAILRLREKKIPVVAIGKRNGKIRDVEIITEKVNVKDIHTVTMYLNPANQKEYYNYIISLNPKRLIFNPGSENIELSNLLAKNKI